MSMVCFERADALHEKDIATRAIQVVDKDSLCAYFQGFYELIYNHKMFGYVYDIYADECCRSTSNGREIKGIPAIEHETMKLCAAFPNLKIQVEDIFAVEDGTDAYKIWLRFYLRGENTATSNFGPPSGLSLEGDRALCLNTIYVRKIEEEWLIVRDMLHLPEDYIRGVCTGDFSFTHVRP